MKVEKTVRISLDEKEKDILEGARDLLEGLCLEFEYCHDCPIQGYCDGSNNKVYEFFNCLLKPEGE